MDTEAIVIYSISLPILRAKELPGDIFQVTGEVVGTCFSIGDGFMLTAGHVLDSLEMPGLVGVVGLTNHFTGLIKSARITGKEKLPCDIGLLKVDFVFPESAN
jgi:hypothetical protein